METIEGAPRIIMSEASSEWLLLGTHAIHENQELLVTLSIDVLPGDIEGSSSGILRFSNASSKLTNPEEYKFLSSTFAMERMLHEVGNFPKLPSAMTTLVVVAEEKIPLWYIKEILSLYVGLNTRFSKSFGLLRKASPEHYKTLIKSSVLDGVIKIPYSDWRSPGTVWRCSHLGGEDEIQVGTDQLKEFLQYCRVQELPWVWNPVTN